MGSPTLVIHTSVYGSQAMADWRHGFKSLRWPRNAAVTDDALYMVWTDDPEGVANLTQGLNATIQPGTKIEALYGSLMVAKELGVPMLYAPPDFIFGDGTVPNLLKICLPSPCRAVAAAHIRVLPKIVHEIDGPKTNAELVGAAFRNLHPIFAQSRVGPVCNSYTTGTSWEELESGVYFATFHIPSVHMLQVIQEDLDYWKDRDPGNWDHEWPTDLIKVHRHRLVGSSDAAFMVELTSEKMHIRAPEKTSHEGHDWYRAWNKYHCLYNANTSVVFRSC